MAVLEASAVIIGFDDLAVLCKAVDESAGHHGITKDAWSFTKREIGGDINRRSLVEAVNQMEQQLP